MFHSIIMRCFACVIPSSSIMIKDREVASFRIILTSSISNANADFFSIGTSWLAVRRKKWSYLGTRAWVHGTNSPQLAKRAATRTDLISVDFPLMLGAVNRNRPWSSTSFRVAVERRIQYGDKPFSVIRAPHPVIEPELDIEPELEPRAPSEGSLSPLAVSSKSTNSGIHHSWHNFKLKKLESTYFKVMHSFGSLHVAQGNCINANSVVEVIDIDI